MKLTKIVINFINNLLKSVMKILPLILNENVTRQNSHATSLSHATNFAQQ